jgi:hypothetical protein
MDRYDLARIVNAPGSIRTKEKLVWCLILFNDYRSPLRPGVKAQCAGNDRPLSSIATQDPGLNGLPFGRDPKRPSAVLRS